MKNRLRYLVSLAALVCCEVEFSARLGAQQRDSSGFIEAGQTVQRTVISIETFDAQGHKSDASGFFIGADGTLVTAAHAVSGTKIMVVTPDHRHLNASLIGADELSDVAVLHVNGATSEGARFRSAALALGEPVAAAGNPLGYQNSLTGGIVSALGRGYGAVTPYDFIQHDAALNPGSSGGPLLDRQGLVVGMNVAIADGARRNVGVSLAVPGELVQRIAQRLLKEGAIRRPQLGVRFREVASLTAAVPDFTSGVLVEMVEANSAAQMGGLQAGDVILASDKTVIADGRDLAKVMEPLKPGDNMPLEILRNGQRLTLQVRLGEAAKPVTLGRTKGLVARSALFGLSFETGTKISAVAAGSPAAEAGLQAGDVLQGVGLKHIETAEQAKAALTEGNPAQVALLINRSGMTRYIVLGQKGRIDSEAGFGSNVEATTSSAL